ncbi:MAG: hypothetical protein KDJ39_15835 [Gammaproteobacteria bacterium]|nr:hypothetical protein [Gammaproteobacteria bacterium]MCP5298604.1 hypothetical protein [Chromatiaceae bacterium]
MNDSLPAALPGRSPRPPALAVALLLGAIAYLVSAAWPLLFPHRQYLASPAPDCDVGSGACTATFDDTRYIRLAQRTAGPLADTALPLLIETGGMSTTHVAIEFSGSGMDMGLVRRELTDVGDGSFAGDVTLPVCIRRHMTWQAIVVADTADAEYRARFRLGVNRD